MSSYFLGCVSLEPNRTGLTLNEDDPTLTLAEQCKLACSSDRNQLFLIRSAQCVCSPAYIDLFSAALNRTECDPADPLVFSAYIASNLKFNQLAHDFAINIDKVFIRDQVEIGDPVGFNITNELTNNYKIYIDFDDNTVKAMLGNSFIFHEYSEAGTNDVNITAVSLTDPSKIFKTEVEIRVLKQTDRLAMFAAKLSASPSDERTVQVSVSVSGGVPYSCYLNYGDNNTNEAYDSLNRTSGFRAGHVYAYAGVYNVSVSCKSELVARSEVRDWVVVYLPYRNASAGVGVGVGSAQTSAAYGVVNLQRVFVQRPASEDKEIDLELPFAMASVNLKFQVCEKINFFFFS